MAKVRTVSYTREGGTYHDRRTFVETICVHSIQEARRLERIVDAAVSRVGEIEGAVEEAGLSRDIMRTLPRR